MTARDSKEPSTVLAAGRRMAQRALAVASLALASADAQGTSTPGEGLTLFAPIASSKTHLLDNTGTVLHSWNGLGLANLMAYLLPNGNVLRSYRIPPAQTGVQEIAFDSTVVWDFPFTVPTEVLHHDIEPLPNGNILMIVWDTKSVAEAIEAGRDPATLPGIEFRPDYIIEVQYAGGVATVVWEWHAWDHLVQDFDPTKANFGVVASSPELVDINVPPGAAINDDWLHTNTVKYNPIFDQICLSPRNMNEIWVIDHSTTTAEAAGHTGGASGMGGDLLYRWGNPQSYRAGSPADQQLFGQHDPNWIEPGFPGAGNIVIFNNGPRPTGFFSSVVEIVPPVDASGKYSLTPGSAYGPTAPTWSYTYSMPLLMYSPAISGAVRLSNGNTLICVGQQGWLLEVDQLGNTVWQHMNMLPTPLTPAIFKVRRYQHYLFPSAETISAGTGGSVTFNLVAGSANAGRTYVLLASTSGTSPGTLVPGTTLTVPLNYDALTTAVLANLNTPAFANFLGVLDSTGGAAAQLTTGPLGPSMVGTTVDFAYALLAPFDFASNPMPVSVVP